MNFQDFQAPNLDSLTNGELKTWKNIFETLSRYCGAKVCAQEYREEGFTQDALQTEALCDRIYNTLPSEVKW